MENYHIIPYLNVGADNDELCLRCCSGFYCNINIIRWKPRHLIQLLPRKLHPRVLGLVIKRKPLVFYALLPRNPVILCNTNAPAHDVPGFGTVLHAKGTRIDDGQSTVRGDIGSLAQLLDAIGALGQVAGLFGDHLHVEGELGIREHEVGLGGTPGPQHALALLDDDIHGIGILLHEPKQVDVLADDLVIRLV